MTNNIKSLRGLVLVFDLDDTITPYFPMPSITEFKYTIKDGGAKPPHHQYDDLNSPVDGTLASAYSKHTAVNNASNHVLNPDIITILRRALIIKGSNPENVSGIFLYTNNSDKEYIDFIHGLLSKQLGVSADVFDDILWASEGILNSRKKNIADIEDLCKRNNISTDDLPNRVYFFDDQIHNNLLETLSKGHYILIKSRVPSINYNMQGYVPAFNSATNLTSVRSALRMTGGTRRFIRHKTRRNKKRYSRKH